MVCLCVTYSVHNIFIHSNIACTSLSYNIQYDQNMCVFVCVCVCVYSIHYIIQYDKHYTMHMSITFSYTSPSTSRHHVHTYTDNNLMYITGREVIYTRHRQRGTESKPRKCFFSAHAGRSPPPLFFLFLCTHLESSFLASAR